MVATVTVNVYTGASGVTESAAVTGIDFISADNATNTLGNRTANPVVVGTNSFSKQIRLKATVAPANGITNFLVWTDGAGTANVGLRLKAAQGTGGATPGTGGVTNSATALSADTDAYAATSGAKVQWDASAYTAINNVTKYILLQLQPTGAATPGNWPQEVISYSYDET
jgi:hypothetical protein